MEKIQILILFIAFGFFLRIPFVFRLEPIRIGSDSSVYLELIYRYLNKDKKKLFDYVQANLINILSSKLGKSLTAHRIRSFMVSFGYDILSSFLIGFTVMKYAGETLLNNENIEIFLTFFCLYWINPLNFISVRLFSLGMRSFSGLMINLIWCSIFLFSESNLDFYSLKFYIFLFSIPLITSLCISAFTTQAMVLFAFLEIMTLGTSYFILCIMTSSIILFMYDSQNFLNFFKIFFNQMYWYVDYLDSPGGQHNKKFEFRDLLNLENSLSQLLFVILFFSVFLIFLSPESFNYITNNSFLILFTSVFFSSIFIQFIGNFKIFGESVRYIQHALPVFFIAIYSEILNFEIYELFFFLSINLVFSIFFSKDTYYVFIKRLLYIFSNKILTYSYLEFERSKTSLILSSEADEILNHVKKLKKRKNFKPESVYFSPFKYSSFAWCSLFLSNENAIYQKLKTQVNNPELLFNYELPNSFYGYSLAKAEYIKQKGFSILIVPRETYKNYYSKNKIRHRIYNKTKRFLTIVFD